MSKIILSRNLAGILPPFMLLELARRNPDKYQYVDTLAQTQRLFGGAAARSNPLSHFVDGGKSTIEVYDCKNGTSRPGKKARFEGEAATGDADVDKAYDFTVAVRKYYLDIHGRNGIDAHGMKMVSSVHYSSGYNNAYWDGSQMTYGDGDKSIFASFVILDVCGHEITHGVTEYESNLEYSYQSGALNESHSDVFGKLIEAYAKKQTVDKIDWVLGRGIFMPGINGEGIRNMMNPGTAYNDPKLGKDPQPAHMKDFINTWDDNGGVHYNSGIPNRAFALFATDVGGYAWEKAGKIWYAARAASGSKAQFQDFAKATVAACGPLGLGANEPSLKKAWAAVGITV